MENYSYNSYPDSGDSSPRSREIDFENPPPWEDQAQQPQSYKAKFMCSYGGKIHPRPHDNQLSYIGGETKILAADRNIKFSAMISKLSALCGGGDVVGTDHALSPGEIQRQIQELQRLQIRDQEHLQELQRLQIRDQEQLAMYRKKNEEAASFPYTGEYYAQKLPEKPQPVTVQQHVPATAGIWPDKQISSGGFPATVTAAPGPPPPADHPVYMIPAPVPGSAPANLYHAPPPVPAPAPASASAAPQMVRPVTGQAGQGYYTNVQRMPHEVYREQPVYNMVAQPQPPPTQHQPISTIPQQVVRPPSSGVTDAGYGHVAAFDRQAYYTAQGGVVPPQYQGVGVAVSGDKRGNVDGKVVYKVSQGSV
ncbi:hypothetical protein ERO13_D04G158200v2 [Gossypium hirsutum]|nr:hypothetical protein ERO13_D04G158200v2 [Gossypium hirsutum]